MTQVKQNGNHVINIPSNEEAERALLGSILIDDSCLIEVASALRDSSDFFLVRHRIIYDAIQRVKDRDGMVDSISLAEALEVSGDLEAVGGRSYLIELSISMGTSMHAIVYAQMVARAAIRRRMMQATSDMYKLVQDETVDIDDIRTKADNTWLDATSDVTKRRGAWMRETMSAYYDELGRMMAGKGVTGITTGLIDVDALVCGFDPEQLIILAGRPGMGKSAAMDNIALNIAKRGIPVFYATSERSKQQVNNRMLAIYTGINSYKISKGKLTPQEASIITGAVGEMAELPIYFDDNPMPRPRDVYAQADWMIKRHGCKIILFDGMYRAISGIDSIDNQNNDHKKYGRIALDLKTMSRALHVPVLATHQLSRAVEQRQDKRPVMSDLRESGRIEEEADKIIFLYRDEVYNQATEFPNACDWILAKHRDGSTGTVTTYFERRNTKFSNASVHRVDLSDLD